MHKTTLAVLALAAFGLSGCDEAAMTAEAGASEQAAAAAEEVAQANVDLSPPEGLTAEERVIWGALNDQAKVDAKAFMAAGGTFAEFYGG